MQTWARTEMKICSEARTHLGRRSNNEDSFLLDPAQGLFVVADGMGGYEGGEVASQLATEAMAAFFQRNASDEDATWPHALLRSLSWPENLLRVAILSAHEAICREKEQRLRQMGTTVAALLLRDGQAIVAHAGDSRVYRLRGEELWQITVDHSLYEQARLARVDLPPRSEWGFGNVITRALGTAEAEPELRTLRIDPGDRFLLCSDGLVERLEESRLRELIRRGPVEESCLALVQAAYDAGGRDNITVVRIDVG